MPAPEWWQRWQGETVFCLASGPSLTREDAEMVRGRGRAITVNTTWKIAPWADVHYASDNQWWLARDTRDGPTNDEQVRVHATGERWTGSSEASKIEGMRFCRYVRHHGLVAEPGVIASGGNGGHAAIGLAYQFGARRIVLLGYDYQKTRGLAHWHGDHAQMMVKESGELVHLGNGNMFPQWIERLERLARELGTMGVEVINCTRETAIGGIRRVPLEEIVGC